MFPTSAAVAAVTAQQAGQGNAFVSSESNEQISEQILKRQLDSAMQTNVNLMPTDTELVESLPERVEDYTDLFPLKRVTSIGGRSNIISSTFGFATTIYRATNINTNQTVCLRRIHSYQPSGQNQKSLLTLIESYKKIHCPTIVRLLQVFTTKDFGDDSIVFAYQYYPQANTMMQQYFNDAQSSAAGGGPNSIYGFSATNRPYSQQHAILKARLLPEGLLWHYIVQMSSSIRLIHALGLAYRTVHPSKILITSPIPKGPPSQLHSSQFPRIRLNACGLYDVIAHDFDFPDRGYDQKMFSLRNQSEDLVAFGQLILALATSSLASTQRSNWATALEQVNRHYSTDLKQLIVSLLSIRQQANGVTINDIMPMSGARFYVQLNSSYEALDTAQAELEREALNGKLFRILVKLSMINDRPELRMDPTWSETGDRYMLKLFREYLFHQVAEDGTPWLDCGHVVSTLTKFNAGSPEKICLISRDGQHVLVVSYGELKKCFNSAFSDLQG